MADHRHPAACDRRRRARGASAIEFVFVAPLLFLLLAGALTFGLAANAKFRMSDAAMVAVRSCVIGNLAQCAATAPVAVATRWPDGARVCGRTGPVVSVTLANSVATVQVRCGFTGGVLQSLLGMASLDMTTSSAMPY